MGARDQFGGAQTSGGGMKYETFKLKELAANNVGVRILPAMKSLRAKGVCVCYHRQHFGYEGISPRDQKRVPRPFVCIEVVNPRTKMTEVSCPECRNQEIHERMRMDACAKVAERCKAQGILDKKTIEMHQKADPEVKRQSEWLRAHNTDKKYFFAVVTSTGKYGLLPIGYKAKQSLDSEIAMLRKQGPQFEPIANFDGGYYFVFSMSKPGESDNVTTASVMKEMRSDGSFIWKQAPLSDEILSKALEFIPDLTDAGLRYLSPTQIQMLVDGSGDPEEVDTIMNMTQPKSEAGSDPEADQTTETPEPAPASKPPPAPSAPTPSPAAKPQEQPAAAAPPPAPPPPAAVEDDEEARLAAKLEALRAEKAAKKAAATAAAQQPPVVKGLDPMDPNLDPAEFAKFFPPPSNR